MGNLAVCRQQAYLGLQRIKICCFVHGIFIYLNNHVPGQKCLKMKNKLQTQCTTMYRIVCCSDMTLDSLRLCTSHRDGTNVKVYRNKCELQKARCRSLDTCIVNLKNKAACQNGKFVCLFVCLTGRPCGTRLGPGAPDLSKSSSQAKKPI